MTYFQTLRSAFEKAFVFEGRLERRSFWHVLMTFLILREAFGIIGFPEGLISSYVRDSDFGLLQALFLIPIIALTMGILSGIVRRLHDTGKSGHRIWLLIFGYLWIGNVFRTAERTPIYTSDAGLIILFWAAPGMVMVLFVLYWCSQTGDLGENKFGPNPLLASPD